MINSRQLLSDLQKLLKGLEKDIRERLESQSALAARLKAEWQSARDAMRTAATYFDWRDEAITQAGAHWILACVFLRFLEDNGYLERPFLFGSDSGTQALARDRRETYFRANPTLSDREYLLACFDEAAKLPGLAGLYDARHNPLFRLGVSGDGAMSLLGFWQKVDPDSGQIIHNFEDPSHATRFLGDLYQDLSESARKRYALLQTPVFIEEFILDRTLTPAIQEFGYREVRLIDPTCGSGHFLLGAFVRFFDLWAKNEPARNLPDLAQRALDAVYGVDLNPFAVEIARFRLLIAALRASEIRNLRAAPHFTVHVAVGDSLLHGRRFGQLDLNREAENLARRGYGYAYATEDLDDINRVLGQQYHAVVGNPPYITPKDTALNQAYRARYTSCHMKYSLGVPFTERFFELTLTGDSNGRAGYVGMITANSFMKREFGRKLIEEFLPIVDLTYVIDTAGAYIPGHGTPTVILVGRGRRPVAQTVRTVMGIKGEPSIPDSPADGVVWRAIVTQVDLAGTASDYVSTADTPRATLAEHPWSIGGGGAAELKSIIEDNTSAILEDRVARYQFSVKIGDRLVTREVLELGVVGMTNADEVILAHRQDFLRHGVESLFLRELVEGDLVRDWAIRTENYSIFPYSDTGIVPITQLPLMARWLWPCRTVLGNRATFSKTTYFAEGKPWWGWHQLALRRIATPLTITLSELATHNHFVLDRGGRVFKHSAPVIKLPQGATEDEYLGLLGLLNSSIACFWLQQVCHNKGRPGANIAGADERYEFRYVHDSSKVGSFPLADTYPTELARQLDSLAVQLAATLPTSLILQGIPSPATFDAARDHASRLRRRMVSLQEELDWHCYRLYALLDDAPEHPRPPEIALGERAFEIVLARRVAAGEEQTTWFERHGAAPITDIPSHWPVDYRAVVERRIALIESDRNIGLIERPECKRRWNAELWEEQAQQALREWLLDRLETDRYWVRAATPRLLSVNQIADAVRLDADFMQIAALYSGRDDFDVAKLVAQLVESEAVPFLPAFRYAPEGLRKRAEWEDTWALQRQEDAIDARIAAETSRNDDESEDDYGKRIASTQRAARKAELGDIAVPPKYKSSDFLSQTFWRLRGGLDVPKERFVGYPLASRAADGSFMVTWAGWDHLQQATALAAHYLDLKDHEGWPPERLAPLLAGLLELVPWLKQWHNEYHAEHGTRMGDYFEGFVQDEARVLGLNIDGLRTWRPSTPARRVRPTRLV